MSMKFKKKNHLRMRNTKYVVCKMIHVKCVIDRIFSGRYDFFQYIWVFFFLSHRMMSDHEVQMVKDNISSEFYRSNFEWKI